MENIYYVMGIISAPPEAGEVLAKGLVEQNLAACVQISSPVTSIYRWEGKLEESKEVLLYLKTEANQTHGIKEYLEKEHPYDVPEFITLGITDGLPRYLKWVWDSLN
jgi:periplasmic divalent cation tolerance protein